MGNNAHYWENRRERSRRAVQHTELMECRFSREIHKASQATKIYSPSFQYEPQETIQNSLCGVENTDSVSAVFTHTSADGKTAVLNFASYKNPGGAFIDGSKAQEECLCHESFLYNVLKRKKSYYEWNNANKNKALYTNMALYSPDILFIRDGETTLCDVITCAAPNYTAAKEYCNVSEEENTQVLKDRIRFVLDIAADNQVDTLILGAYGCGVFGQNPKEVASIFKELLESQRYPFSSVIFAIPKSERDSNYESFVNTFSEKEAER